MSRPSDSLSYYRATANAAPSHPPLTGRHNVDVCIIGAGYTGLSAAIELAKRGYRVKVLEAGPVGWGASGRNGGQICSGYSPGMAKFERTLGPELARACFGIAEEGKALLAERIRRYGIDCNLRWGYIHGAVRKGHVAELAAMQAEYARYGYADTQLLSMDEMRARIGSEVFLSGLYEPKSGHLHALNYCLGLAAAAVTEGAELHEQSRVTSITPGPRVRVVTAQGEVSAAHVILGCNAHINGLVPQMARRIMPVGSFMIATEPLGEARARSLIAGDEAVVDSNFVVDYFRLSADRRLIYGGACSYSGVEPSDIAAFMRPKMLRVFPQLADVKIDYGWGGYIAITYSRLPDMNRIAPNVYYAQGYSGQGVVLAGMFGKIMAEAVAGQAERFDIFSRISHLPFPGGPMKRPALVMGMLWYRLRDLLS